jgi:hypothetical protein
MRRSSRTPIHRRGEPKPLVRTAVATLGDASEFGWLVAAEACRRGFFPAPRRAFVGDGGNWIGPLGETHFSGWLIVLDFVRLLFHLFRAASAAYADDPQRAWLLYVELLRDAWKGRAARVIERLESEAARLRRRRRPPLAAIRSLELDIDYVRNNRERMDYPRYRREGLPISSASVESLIKQFNQRLKGTGKTWTPSRAEGVLQSRAAYLSQDDRAAKLFTQRPYRRAANHGPLPEAGCMSGHAPPGRNRP